MKLLIITQKVDKNDPILGFFHRWVEEFSKNLESLIVICLYEGDHNLPGNVKVLSLGKEKRKSKIKYLLNFYKYIWRERRNYDKVFVHMNQIYVVLGGILWRIMGKKIALWYTHKKVSLSLRLATLITNSIFTASKESFRINSKKVFVLGHGIDTDFFSPNSNIKSSSALISVGRLMPSKRHDIVIEATVVANRTLRIAGDGPEKINLENQAKKLHASVEFLGPLTQQQMRDEYRKVAFLIHVSETGSLDKVVLEAFACGLRVISTSDSLSGLPIIKVDPTPEAIAKAVSVVYSEDTKSLVDYVRENHSLQKLIPKILKNLENI